MTGETESYREIIGRDAPWWTVRLTGPHLPPEGVSARSRTFGGILEAAAGLYPSELDYPDARDAACVTEYDLGESGAALDAFIKARRALRDARRAYFDTGRRVTAALASDQKATLRDIAEIIHEPYAEVARFRAYRPEKIIGVDSHDRSLRHYLIAHAAPAAAYMTGWGARLAGMIVADALREVRSRRSPES